MLRYKTETRPGLVALYDIRPGNGVGQFLQPHTGQYIVNNNNNNNNSEIVIVLMHSIHIPSLL